MTDCRQTQLEMIGSAMSLEALRHLENCAACRARLCAEQSLSAALGATPSYDAPAAPVVRYTPFLVLDPLSPDLAAGRGRLVRATLPSSAPAAYGLFLPDTQGTVEADVLLGDDGAIYAVRFVY